MSEMSEKRNGHVPINGTNGGTKYRLSNGKPPFLIGVAGGTASGKSTVCKRIMEKLGQQNVDQTERQVVCISQDSFYRKLTPEEKIKAEKGQFNFDHPDAFDSTLMYQTINDILLGKRCEIPVYDYRTNSQSGERTTTIYPADVVLVEGILVFYHQEIRNLFHMKLFVDTDSDLRLARRVLRDIKDRGRDLDQVLNQYTNYVKLAFEEFCLPTKKFADVIIPRGADNTVAIDLIVHHIWDILHGSVTIDLGLEPPFCPKQRDNTKLQNGNGNTESVMLAIELIVQHIRDLLNDQVTVATHPPAAPPTPPSPARRNQGDGNFMRPH